MSSSNGPSIWGIWIDHQLMFLLRMVVWMVCSCCLLMAKCLLIWPMFLLLMVVWMVCSWISFDGQCWCLIHPTGIVPTERCLGSAGSWKACGPHRNLPQQSSHESSDAAHPASASCLGIPLWCMLIGCCFFVCLLNPSCGWRRKNEIIKKILIS